MASTVFNLMLVLERPLGGATTKKAHTWTRSAAHKLWPKFETFSDRTHFLSIDSLGWNRVVRFLGTSYLSSL